MDKKAQKSLGSRAYKKASQMVDGLLASPEKLIAISSRAADKLQRVGAERLGDSFASLSASLRLLKAYAAGTYRDVSLESLGLVVAAIVYFLMPLDALPDFIVALGLTDDAAVLAWTYQTVRKEIDKFIGWESSLEEGNSEDDIPSSQ